MDPPTRSFGAVEFTRVEVIDFAWKTEESQASFPLFRIHTRCRAH
jgi:hypothetical protein